MKYEQQQDNLSLVKRTVAIWMPLGSAWNKELQMSALSIEYSLVHDVEPFQK